MNRIVLLLILLFLPLSVASNHTSAAIDLCEIYKDKLPPGLTADLLPEAPSQGAKLLAQYCTQCHNLPGPARHTATKWREVTSKMFMLMDVSSIFGGMMGKVETMQLQDQEILRTYLEHNATNSEIIMSPADRESTGHLWPTRSLALLPVLLLTGAGLLRWRRNLRHGH